MYASAYSYIRACWKYANRRGDLYTQTDIDEVEDVKKTTVKTEC